ncbi:MAG TPA: bifunctional glutamate N-acetyltransferase/amino-acid acetyltransferase ArgJ, partial [Candidatus Latescibacteria bacterium]|nr:bifunctional glutamate N-acetyltransferase/amino-acid acetyltransferase ArgJ [Candidatus Latescibacterota bacterium]
MLVPKGFLAGAGAGGIKYEDRPDVAVIFSEVEASAAGVFTRNKVQAAPVRVSQEHIQDGKARAIVGNSGNANACTGKQGLKDARRMAELVASELGLRPEEVLVASTGVIGMPLPMDRVERGIREACRNLGPDGWEEAEQAIMTTDAKPKFAWMEISGARTLGMAKGSGMIAPDLATMLAFLVTDAEVEQGLLWEALRAAARRTFNRLTVDGDTSTNDTVFILANGASGVGFGKDELPKFARALEEVCLDLARQMARDGEGATKLIVVRVKGARSEEEAGRVARAVAESPLVKTAMFGKDPNWGRVLAAVGRSGVDVEEE